MRECLQVMRECLQVMREACRSCVRPAGHARKCLQVMREACRSCVRPAGHGCDLLSWSGSGVLGPNELFVLTAGACRLCLGRVTVGIQPPNPTAGAWAAERMVCTCCGTCRGMMHWSAGAPGHDIPRGCSLSGRGGCAAGGGAGCVQGCASKECGGGGGGGLPDLPVLGPCVCPGGLEQEGGDGSRFPGECEFKASSTIQVQWHLLSGGL